MGKLLSDNFRLNQPRLERFEKYSQSEEFKAKDKAVNKTVGWKELEPEEPASEQPAAIPAAAAAERKPTVTIEELEKVSDDFYTTTIQGRREKVEGQPVKIPGHEEFDFFVHKTKGGWAVSEAMTGTRAAFAQTKGKAIEELSGKLKGEGKESLRALINERLKLHNGPTPRYGVKGKPAAAIPAAAAAEREQELVQAGTRGSRGSEAPASGKPFAQRMKEAKNATRGGN